MHCGPRASPLCIQHCIQLTSLSFPSQSIFPFLKYGYKKFDLGNPRSRSWVRSKLKVTTWVQHPIDPHPFDAMSIHPLIAMIELFENLTFKIQGQSHSSRSHSWYNILSAHILFVPCWSALPFLRHSYFKNWPWKSKVKVMAEVKFPSHNVSLTSYRLLSLWFHVNWSSHSWDIYITFSKFDLGNRKVKVIK